MPTPILLIKSCPASCGTHLDLFLSFVKGGAASLQLLTHHGVTFPNNWGIPTLFIHGLMLPHIFTQQDPGKVARVMKNVCDVASHISVRSACL